MHKESNPRGVETHSSKTILQIREANDPKALCDMCL